MLSILNIIPHLVSYKCMINEYLNIKLCYILKYLDNFFFPSKIKNTSTNFYMVNLSKHLCDEMWLDAFLTIKYTEITYKLTLKYICTRTT